MLRRVPRAADGAGGQWGLYLTPGPHAYRCNNRQHQIQALEMTDQEFKISTVSREEKEDVRHRKQEQ
jgi:hypothetical protein